MVRPESVAEAPWSTWKTRLAPPPLIASLSRPGPRILIGPVGLLSSSWPAVRSMTAGPEKADLSKVMVAPPSRTSARLTAWRRLSWPRPEPRPSMAVSTTSGPGFD
jgi:hypothetical protein